MNWKQKLHRSAIAALVLGGGVAQAHMGGHDHVGLWSGLMHLLLEHGPLLLILAVGMALPLHRRRKSAKSRIDNRED
jgi:hydrogenase/urease accessory protein HupE